MLADDWHDLPSGARVRTEGGRPVELFFLDTEDVPADLAEMVAEAEELTGVALEPIGPEAITPGEGRREFIARLSPRAPGG